MKKKEEVKGNYENIVKREECIILLNRKESIGYLFPQEHLC